MNLIEFSAEEKDYFDMVINPLDTEKRAIVPDLNRHEALLFKDYAEFEIGNNADAAAAHSVLVVLLTGVLPAIDAYMANDANGRDTNLYKIGLIWLNSLGQPIALTTTQSGDYIQVIGYAAYGTLFGSTSSPFSSTSSLIDSQRTIAAGLRALPKVETVTDTSQFHVRRYVGGYLSEVEIFNAIANTESLKEVMWQGNDMETFGNEEGCCVRLDPFQDPRQLFPLPLVGNPTNSSYDVAFGQSIRYPAILVELSQVLDTNDVPVYFSSILFTEGTVKRPSPLQSTMHAVDPRWPEHMRMIAASDALYPLVTKGHSFKSLQSVMNKVFKVSSYGISGLKSLFDGKPGKAFKDAKKVMKIINGKTKSKKNNKRKGIVSKLNIQGGIGERAQKGPDNTN